MLALTIDAMLDFAGERTGHFRMIGCEAQSHDAYGTPRELFGRFFGVIADTLREVLGADDRAELPADDQRRDADLRQLGPHRREGLLQAAPVELPRPAALGGAGTVQGFGPWERTALKGRPSKSRGRFWRPTNWASSRRRI